MEHMAVDDPEAYQNWVRSVEKQRIQVCCIFPCHTAELSFYIYVIRLQHPGPAC